MLSNFWVTMPPVFLSKSDFPAVLPTSVNRLWGRLLWGTSLIHAWGTNSPGIDPVSVRLGGGEKQRSTLPSAPAGCLGAKIGKVQPNFTRTAPGRRQGAHWLLACRRAWLRSLQSLAARLPARSGPIGVAALNQ